MWILQLVLSVLICSAAFYVAADSDTSVWKDYPFSGGGTVEASSGTEISIPDYTETQLLSEAYNRMLRRMKLQEDSRQEFVSNVSHELKTPITSMKVLADSLLAQDNVPVELYKEFHGRYRRGNRSREQNHYTICSRL